MKYAIRLSHVPPAVLYLTTDSEPADVIKEIHDRRKLDPGVFHFVLNLFSWYYSRWVVELVEDETSIVFTDPKDADYLITPVNGVWSAHRCK